jgi:CheY-like chemotaxis protein
MLANTPQQALEAIQVVRPDLFVLDYQLPLMDGLKLYDHLHSLEAFHETPAILMSANLPMNEIKKRGISYIQKPFELEEFLKKIEALLKA